MSSAKILILGILCLLLIFALPHIMRAIQNSQKHNREKQSADTYRQRTTNYIERRHADTIHSYAKTGKTLPLQQNKIINVNPKKLR